MSTTTIELSTIIPNTTIRAANVTVLSSIPKASINPKDIKIDIGMEDAATPATRKGNNIIVTSITATIAIINSFRKVVIE